MSLKKCKECGNEVSSMATSCPKCGSPVTQKTRVVASCCALAILVPVVLVIVVALLNTNRGARAPGPASGDSSTVTAGGDPAVVGTHKMGETITIGYTTYCPSKAWWSNALSNNRYLNRRPDAAFLFIDVTVRNDDKSASMIPPFKLVDEGGAEYDSDSGADMVDGSLGLLTSLNPGVSKRGFVVFDAPREHTYRLKVSGGYLSGKDALFEVEPTEKERRAPQSSENPSRK
jgi:hypothetical protein